MPFPFRLGTTSCIYEDDDLVGNVCRLGPLVDDIELVLFDTDDYGANIPDAVTVSELCRLATEHCLTYTAHLPMDLWPENDSLPKAARAIEATRALRPFAYIAHLDGRTLPPYPALNNTSEWEQQSAKALDAVITMVGDPTLVCVENLEGWDPYLFEGVVREKGTSRCVDIGHLWLEQADAVTYLLSHMHRANVIHLHGIHTRDHASLALMPADDISDILDLLLYHDHERVVTLEVFCESDFLTSLEVLRRCFDALKP